MFVLGTVLSAVVIFYQMVTLRVCLEEEDGRILAYFVHAVSLILLIFGLVVDLSSAVVLSKSYKVPLDVKSVYKIKPEKPKFEDKGCVARLFVYVLVPFSWAVIYFFGAFVSMTYGLTVSCGGGMGGPALQTYLVVSGAVMVLICFTLLVLSCLMLVAVCCGCTSVRKACLKGILSKSWFLDLLWRLQCVAIFYRSSGTRPLEPFLEVAGIVLAYMLALLPQELYSLCGCGFLVDLVVR